MSEATKRKHVHLEVLQRELVPPKENQLIVKVLDNRGSNLHEVETPESKFLVTMPNKFRKNVWIKRGDYVLIEVIDMTKKVKGEIVTILTPDYIKYLKAQNLWPVGFSQKTESPKGVHNDYFVDSSRKTISSHKEFSDNDE